MEVREGESETLCAGVAGAKRGGRHAPVGSGPRKERTGTKGPRRIPQDSPELCPAFRLHGSSYLRYPFLFEVPLGVPTPAPARQGQEPMLCAPFPLWDRKK